MAAMLEHSVFSHANFISKTQLGADHGLGRYKYIKLLLNHLDQDQGLRVFVTDSQSMWSLILSHFCRSLT